MKKSMRIIASAAAIMISGSMFVQPINNINAADTASEQQYLWTITDPLTEAFFIVEHQDKNAVPDMYYWSTEMKDQSYFPVKIEDLKKDIDLSTVKKIIKISPENSKEMYFDCGDRYMHMAYYYGDDERGWSSRTINYYKKDCLVKYTSENTEPSQDPPPVKDDSELVPLTTELLKEYQEIALKEAIFTVEFSDGHNQEYYWSTEMEFPVKIEEINKDIVNPEKVEKRITITPDNTKKTIIERDNCFQRIFYNYSADKWENDENRIPKETKPEECQKYYLEKSIHEAIIVVQNGSENTEKFYYGSQTELPVKFDEINKYDVDLSKVEKVIYDRCHNNPIPVELSYEYREMEYIGYWRFVDNIAFFKEPPINYGVESPSVELPEGSTDADVNKDGILNVVDLIKLKCAFLSDDEYNDSYNYDVNSDGIVSAADIAELKSILVKAE